MVGEASEAVNAGILAPNQDEVPGRAERPATDLYPPCGMPQPESTAHPIPAMSEALEFEATLFPNPVLRKVADPITAFDDALKRTVEAMYTRMFESQGVGLAAPQVGLRQRILVVNETGDAKEADQNLTLINPQIVARSGKKVLLEEGCLSFPGIYAEIERLDGCVVEAQDIEGNPIRLELEGFLSRIVQHEFDHLEGILLVDRMSPADKIRNKGELEELKYMYLESKR